MITEEQNFMQKNKDWYYKIGFIKCPAFNSEPIYFNKHGWYHLFRKRGLLRSKDEKIKRFELLKYVPYIIATTLHISRYEDNIANNQKAHFWMIQRYIKDILVKVIIRQIGNGQKHFFSVMKENKKTPD